MAEMRELLVAKAKEMANYEGMTGILLDRSERRDSVASRVLNFVKFDRGMRALYDDYSGGTFGPMLRVKPESGKRCGLFTASLKDEMAEAYWDARALFIVANPATESVLYGMNEAYAKYVNDEAAERVAKRNLGEVTK